MARIACTTLVIVLLSVLVGCQSTDSGKGLLMPTSTRSALGSAPTVQITGKSEADIVEHMAVNRQSYRQGLELLVEYYAKTGNSTKLNLAKKELDAMNSVPQYKYILAAVTEGPNLRASVSIPEADEFFADAYLLQKKAGELVILKDNNLLRQALDRYDRLIKEYPTSNKIDDAAFQAALIYEHFKDYSYALIYYQRAYQWDPDTANPARFRAARILDKYQHRRAEALELYRQALEEEAEFVEWKEFAIKRIREITQSASSR